MIFISLGSVLSSYYMNTIKPFDNVRKWPRCTLAEVIIMRLKFSHINGMFTK